jgi:hypothetical protein
MLINAIVGGQTAYKPATDLVPYRVPYKIGGVFCQVDTDRPGVTKVEGGHDTDDETVSFVEYWLDGELIHRSVNMHIKRGLFAEGIAADFGGN